MSVSNGTDGDRLMADTDKMQRFTATGRPYKPPTAADKRQMALGNIAVEDTIFGTAPVIQPFRYNDDSLISVPVLRPEDVASYGQRATAEPEKKRFWKSRRSSRDGGLNENFIIKRIPRGEYLKRYAKDEEGRYVGTEEPAADCLLRGADYEKWRGAKGGVLEKGGFRSEIEGSDGFSIASTLAGRKENDNGVIR